MKGTLIPKIAYEGSGGKNPLAFKFYDEDEVVNGKKMSERLKFALSYWHTIDSDIYNDGAWWLGA